MASPSLFQCVQELARNIQSLNVWAGNMKSAKKLWNSMIREAKRGNYSMLAYVGENNDSKSYKQFVFVHNLGFQCKVCDHFPDRDIEERQGVSISWYNVSRSKKKLRAAQHAGSEDYVRTLQNVSRWSRELKSRKDEIRGIKSIWKYIISQAKKGVDTCAAWAGSTETVSGKQLNTAKTLGFQISSVIQEDASRPEEEQRLYTIAWKQVSSRRRAKARRDTHDHDDGDMYLSEDDNDAGVDDEDENNGEYEDDDVDDNENDDEYDEDEDM